jgi:hypothetical protein
MGIDSHKEFCDYICELESKKCKQPIEVHETKGASKIRDNISGSDPDFFFEP